LEVPNYTKEAQPRQELKKGQLKGELRKDHGSSQLHKEHGFQHNKYPFKP
jgi:hypothetical protein